MSAAALSSSRTDFDLEVSEKLSDTSGQSYEEGWFCVSTNPWPCPADGCGFVALYLTAAHLVVVWPAADDSALLANAANAREVGRNPRILEYEQSFGPCIAWDEWWRIGRPVHGLASKPEGWEGRPWRI